MTTAGTARSIASASAFVLITALAAAGCTSPAQPEPEPSGFASVDHRQPGWVEAAPGLAATLVAHAYAATAPTTLRVRGEVERLHTPGLSPEQVVDDVTTGDGAEVLTDEARAQLERIAREVRDVGGFASVDVAPCDDDGLGDDLPTDAWFDRSAREVLVRTCVHVTGVGADEESTVTETVEPLVVAARVPEGTDALGTGPTSRVLRLDDPTWHDVLDSGLPWYEYVARRL